MYDPGTTTFMIMSCALVLMMGPALALFYGGLSRRKNVVNTMLMCVMAMGAVGCLWAVLGDSIAYGGPDAFDEDGNLVNVAALFAGGFDRLFSSWSLAEMIDALSAVPENATYADVAVGTYPGLVDVAFQAAFAMVTAAIVTGSLAGRMSSEPSPSSWWCGQWWYMPQWPIWFGVLALLATKTQLVLSILRAVRQYISVLAWAALFWR